MDTMLDTMRGPILTKIDRCDQCNANAMVRVTTKNLGTFLFCGHDFDRNKDVLPGITHIHDERNPLAELSNGEAVAK